MARYRCSVCGYIYDEEKEGKPISELVSCPVCHQSAEKFVLIEEHVEPVKKPAARTRLITPENLSGTTRVIAIWKRSTKWP